MKRAATMSKTAHISCLKGMVPAILLLFAAVGCGDGAVDTQTRIIAHRGYWDVDGSAQNSLASLRLAAQAGVYGSEFDVNVTSDGIPLIFHDNEIEGKKIEDHPYADFADFRLSNGEPVPLLDDYLAEGVKYPAMKLILELKSSSSPEIESRNVRIVTDAVERADAGPQVEYIAFSLHVLREILRIDPQAATAYLNGDLTPDELHELGVSGLDYNQKIMLANPEWFARARELGLSTNTWTVNDPETMDRMIALGVDCITTDKPLLLRERIAEKSDGQE